jgi:hypothetical protein
VSAFPFLILILAVAFLMPALDVRIAYLRVNPWVAIAVIVPFSFLLAHHILWVVMNAAMAASAFSLFSCGKSTHVFSSCLSLDHTDVERRKRCLILTEQGMIARRLARF